MKSRSRQGYTSAELMLVLALGAMIIGGVVVSFGTLIRNQPRVSSVVTLNIGNRLAAFYGIGGTTINVNTAPNYGAVAIAEKLREQFHSDIISATAVFCLGRDATVANTFHPTTIPFDPTTDSALDTPTRFLAHLRSKSLVTAAQFNADRQFTAPKPNATVFILGYSKFANQLTVTATYDIDFIRVTNPTGTYASVKRYTNNAQPLYYDIFYEPSTSNATRPDSFVPLYVSFERASRRSNDEGAAIERFKRAAERPFYLIWWPDPGARNLETPTNSSFTNDDPRVVYNQQGGRTSFMFTVPMFPAL